MTKLDGPLIILVVKTPDVVKALSALAQDSRLAIFRLLVKRGPDGFGPGEIGEKLDIPLTTLSFHLKELQNGGLLNARREGRFVYYSAKFARVRELAEFLTEECCSQSDEQCDENCQPLVTPAMQRRRARG